jgi:hypothetical protein
MTTADRAVRALRVARPALAERGFSEAASADAKSADALLGVRVRDRNSDTGWPSKMRGRFLVRNSAVFDLLLCLLCSCCCVVVLLCFCVSVFLCCLARRV